MVTDYIFNAEETTKSCMNDVSLELLAQTFSLTYTKSCSKSGKGTEWDGKNEWTTVIVKFAITAARSGSPRRKNLKIQIKNEAPEVQCLGVFVCSAARMRTEA